MLKPAWYVVGDDFLTQVPRPDRSGTDTTGPIVDAVEALLSDESSLDPSVTLVAVRLGLLSAIRVNDSACRTAGLHTVAELVLVLQGLAQLHAYLTQTIQELSDHLKIRHLGTPHSGTEVAYALEVLQAAVVNGELVAGHLKQAYESLRGIAR